MLFILRMAFWIALVCLLLPGSQDSNQKLISSAEQTVNDVRGFCQRNPQVCEDARLAMTGLLLRLKSGADMLQGWVAKQETPVEEPPAAPAEKGSRRYGRNDHAPPQPVAKWQDSLNPGDKQVPWRGPSH
jgi:hypothetical protein